MGSKNSVDVKQKEPLVHEIVGLVMKNENSLNSYYNDIGTILYPCLIGLSSACVYYGEKKQFSLEQLTKIQKIQSRYLKLAGCGSVVLFSSLFTDDLYRRHKNYKEACQIANMIKPLLETNKNDYKIVYHNPSQGSLLFHDNKFSFSPVKNPVKWSSFNRYHGFSLYAKLLLGYYTINEHLIPNNKRFLISDTNISNLHKDIDDDKIEIVSNNNASIINDMEKTSDNGKLDMNETAKISDNGKLDMNETAKTSDNSKLDTNKVTVISNADELGTNESNKPRTLYYGLHYRPIITNNSTTVHDSVMLGGDIIIMDTENSLYLNELESKFKKKCNPVLKDNYVTVLTAIYNTVTCCIWPMNVYNYKDNSDVFIDQAILNGTGVCRHHALLIAHLIEYAIKFNYLDGTFKYKRHFCREFFANSGHAWVEYTHTNGDVYILDGANGIMNNIEYIGLSSKKELKLKEEYYLQ